MVYGLSIAATVRTRDVLNMFVALLIRLPPLHTESSFWEGSRTEVWLGLTPWSSCFGYLFCAAARKSKGEAGASKDCDVAGLYAVLEGMPILTSTVSSVALF